MVIMEETLPNPLLKKNSFYWKTALILALITIFYNIVEGLICIYFGLSDDALSLLGFGVDSFVEVISGIGILHMVLRIRRAEIQEHRDKFEKQALRITGYSFYLLAGGLGVGSLINLYRQSAPETTMVGIIVALASIAGMWALYWGKIKTGRALNSEAIIADANCTKTCLQLSFVLLGASLLYEFFQVFYIDIIGSLGIAYFAFKEGRESLEKSKSDKLSCGDCCD